MPAPTEYRGTITREQWLLNETRTVARLRLDEGIATAKELVELVLEENSFCYPTQKEQPSIARACWRSLCGYDWNTQETPWSFKRNPLV